jgi:DNA-binding transcriptional ArsR family regulator
VALEDEFLILLTGSRAPSGAEAGLPPSPRPSRIFYLAILRNILDRYFARWLNILVATRSRQPRADTYEAVFSALAHAARRRVLLTIYFNGGSMTAGEIAAIFEHAWQTTTRHLRVLEKAGLLSCEKRGRTRIYRIERKRLALVRDWLDHFSKDHKTGDRSI